MKLRIGLLLLVSVCQNATADVAFDGPVSCTLEKRRETAVTRFFPGQTLSAPYGYHCWDMWHGNNTGQVSVPTDQFENDQYVILDWSNRNPRRSAIEINGFSGHGKPISRLYVTLFANSEEASEPLFNRISPRMHLRWRNHTYSWVGCPAKVYPRLPSWVQDVSFTAEQIRDAGGKLNFDVITYDFTRRAFDSDRLTCTGTKFLDL